MLSRETVKLGLAGVFWELLQTDDPFDGIQDTDEVEEFCDEVFRKSVGMGGDVQAQYFNERLEAYVKEFAEKRGLKVYTGEDDRLVLDDDIQDMEDGKEPADGMKESFLPKNRTNPKSSPRGSLIRRKLDVANSKNSQSVKDVMGHAQQYVIQHGNLPVVTGWRRRDISKKYPWLSWILNNYKTLGGMRAVREKLGLNPLARQIWTPERIEAEACKYLRKNVEFPTAKEGKKIDWCLAVGRGNYRGGLPALRVKLGLPRRRPPEKFRHTQESVVSDYLSIIAKLGHLPPSSKVNEKKYPCLKYLPLKYPGGRRQFELDHNIISTQRERGATQSYVDNQCILDRDFDELHKKHGKVPRTSDLMKENNCLMRAIWLRFKTYEEYLSYRKIEPVNYQRERARYKTKEQAASAYGELYKKYGRALNRSDIGVEDYALYKSILRFWGGLDKFHASDSKYKKAVIIARDGHICDSYNEMIFDNLSDNFKINHIRDVEIQANGHRYEPDFIVNEILIEVVMPNRFEERNSTTLDSYRKKMRRKFDDYDAEGLNYKTVYADDLEDGERMKELLSSVSNHCSFPRIPVKMVRKRKIRFYDKEDVIEKLKQLGVDGTLPTTTKIRNDFEWGHSLVKKLYKFFGSYEAAAKAAGFSLPRNRTKRKTDKDFTENQ